jgi:hypothetical protein
MDAPEPKPQGVAMDDQISSRDPQPISPTEPLRAVPGSNPPAPPRQKKRPGPKTPQGKARSSRNPTRFGIHSADPVIPGLERLEDWKAHREGIVTSAAPVGYHETELAGRMALLLWRLNRIITYEQAEYARANKGSNDFRLPDLNELDKIMRYEAHLSRQLYQAKHELEVLQKQRRGEPTPLARLDVQGAPEQAGLVPEAGVYEVKTITPLNP